MPLVEDPASAICEDARVGIGFSMLDGSKKVVVWVDKAALRTLRDSKSISSDLRALEQHREALEAIASANYDVGIVEPDGSTIIRRDDVEGLG